MLLSETKLNCRHHVEFKNYQVIRQDRPNSRNGGGTAILLKRDMQFEHVKISKLQNSRDVENTIIKIKLKNNKYLYLIAIYCSSHNSPEAEKQFETEWTQIFELLGLINMNKYFILAGDINARHSNWGNAIHNKRGIALNRWHTNNSFLYKAKIYKPNKPTYTPTESYLDLAIADNRLNIATDDHGEIPTHFYESDHRAIEIKCLALERSEEHIEDISGRLIYQFNNTIWAIWTKKLQNIYHKYLKRHTHHSQMNIVPNDKNICNNDLEAYIEIITDIIHENLMMTQPKVRHKNNMECYTNRTIEQLYHHKSRIVTQLKKLKRRGTVAQNSEIVTLKAEIRRTNQLISENVKIQVNKYWQNKIESITPGPKMFSQMKQMWKSRDNSNIEQLEIDANEARNISNICVNWNNLPKTGNKFNSYNTQLNLEIIGHYIEQQTVPSEAAETSPHEAIVEQQVNKLKNQHRLEIENGITKTMLNTRNRANDTTDKYFITTDELRNILSCCNNKKSFGIDQIPNIVLKHLPDEIIVDLCTIINNLLNNRSFPSCWKTARIFPILKKSKDPKNAKNYRPISLLSNLSKIYEIVIHNKIQTHIENNSLMPDNQFGFRRDHSTVHAVTKITSDVCQKLNINVCTGAMLIDMTKAFESVWLDGLIFKLQKLKFEQDLIKILLDMLYNREFITTTGTEISRQTFRLHNGLQQGTINAPVLFNLYTSDLIKNEKLNSEAIQTIAYADDIIVYSAAPKIKTIQQNIQTAINFIIAFLKTWRIQINPEKCEAILFRRPYKLSTCDTKQNWKSFKIQINNINVEQKKIVKYLGINLDRFCYLTDHINIQLTKANRALFINKRLFYSKFLDPKVKRICYQTLIRPIITYGCPVWFNCSDSYMERIRKFERVCIRRCRGEWRKADTGYKHYISNQNQYDNFEIERIDLHILNLIRNHILRTTRNLSNSLTFGPLYTDDQVIQNTIQIDKIPGPDAFIYLDKMGYIQNDDQIPIIYHIRRLPNEKGFDVNKMMNPEDHMRYSTAFKRMDALKFVNDKLKYWWLSATS